MTPRTTVNLTSGVMPRRLELFDQMLRLFPPGALVDLGAGHGQFAVRAARAGWRVTAVDARRDRFPAEPSVTWLRRDVRSVDLRPYDVVACLGLFYHLTPQDQLSLLRRSAAPLILDTHVDTGLSTHALSEREEVDGYEGSWYTEPGALTSSWGNERSFWPTPESLYRMLGDCGYPVVLAAQPWVKPDRTFFLALPAGYALPAPPALLARTVRARATSGVRAAARRTRGAAGRVRRRLADRRNRSSAR